MFPETYIISPHLIAWLKIGAGAGALSERIFSCVRVMLMK